VERAIIFADHMEVENIQILNSTLNSSILYSFSFLEKEFRGIFLAFRSDVVGRLSGVNY
jgi:hypothetical protein